MRIKLNAMREAVDGKRVIMIDDCYCKRYDLQERIVQLLRDAGAKEVHVENFIAAVQKSLLFWRGQ